jgi:hypothetical protein
MRLRELLEFLIVTQSTTCHRGVFYIALVLVTFLLLAHLRVLLHVPGTDSEFGFGVV